MCGICGTFDTLNERRTDQYMVQRMIEKLNHRGPDGSRFYAAGNLALGFTRLSIIDLEGGMQPLFNEDNTVVAICNGEIFNYIELREDLLRRGHKFRTHCDIEVIIHLYEEKGADFLNDLNGQFALALYDSKKQELICARDYAGIVPFFYTMVDGLFIFASEIKAILEYPGVNKAVDLVGLDQVLTFPGMVSPRTFFKDIHSLESGHYLVLSPEGLRKYEYWDLIYPRAGDTDYIEDEEYYIEKLDALLTNAVRLRLRADVPTGFYISGGLDSAVIASKINQLCPNGSRHSFSIDFTDKRVSEAKYQRLMAEYVQSVHHEILFDFADIADGLPQVVYHAECALKESYNTASVALSGAVRAKGIKAVLTGEGADELFGGYVGYRFDKMRQLQHNALSPAELRLNQQVWGNPHFMYEKEHSRHERIKRQLYSSTVNSIYKDIDCLQHHVIRLDRVEELDDFHRRSYIDFKLRMSDHLLSDHGDRMSYANSVEARYPFLDKELIEFVRTIPAGLKLNQFNEKYILKKTAERFVPKEILDRPKFAFTAPGSPEILKQKNEYIQDLLSYERIKRQGYLNPDVIEKLKMEYMEPGFKLNVPYDNDLLITAITFGIFLDRFKLPDLM